MKLPISLLLLAAVAQAAKHGKDKSRASSPTIKRELFEGNFGQKTKLSAMTEVAPENQLSDELKEAFYDPSATHHQIFGARLPQITKISDLLTGQGLPFEVAVNNHLYSPVSAYNTRLSSPMFELQSPAATKNIFDGPKIYRPKLIGPEDLPANKDAAFHHPELFSYAKQNDHVGADSFSRPDLSPNYLQEKYLHSNPFQQSPNSHLLPIFGGKPFEARNHNLPLQFYQQHHQQPIQYVPLKQGFENGKVSEQSKKTSNGEKELPKGEPIKKPAQGFPSIPQHQQSYHAHPNGALSYASFTHSLAQAHLNGHPGSHLQYKEPSNVKQHAVPQLHQEPIYVPDVYLQQAPHQIQGHKVPSSRPQLQFVSVPKQYYHELQSPPILQAHHTHGFQKFSDPQFASALQNHHNQLYLNPVRQHLLRELHQKSIEQVEPSQMSEVRQESSGASQAHQMTAQSNQLPETRPHKLIDHSAERDVRIIPLHRYTPTPASITYDHAVKPLSSRPPLESQRERKYHQESAPDQLVQATTHQPETENSPRADEPESNPHHQKSTLTPTPTPSLLASPVTLQSLSTIEPASHVSSTPHPEILLRQEESHSPATQLHSVQIQLQQLQELHSELEPQSHLQQSRSQKEEHESSEQYQSLSTPQPNEPSKPDYEIEIAANVDHSKLPKDLRPVNTHHGEPPLQVQQNQPQTQESKPHQPHEEQNSQLTHNQLEEQNHPQLTQDHSLLEQNHHQLAQSHQQLADNHQQLAHHHQSLAQNQVLDGQSLRPGHFQHSEAIQTPHEPNISELNNPFINTESSVPGPFHTPIKAIIQPQGFSHPQGFAHPQGFIAQPDFHHSHVDQSDFPPVQYFGNFAESIFGDLHH